MATSSQRADTPRNAINDFTRFLKKAAADAGCSPRADTADKETLRKASKLLAQSVKNLIKISDQSDALIAASADLPPESARRRAALGAYIVGGHVDLSSLLWAATTIGSRVLNNPVARRELAAMQTATASKRKKDNAAKRKKLVLKLFDDLRRKEPDASDRHIAGMIEKSMTALLGKKDVSGKKKNALSQDRIYRIVRNHRSD